MSRGIRVFAALLILITLQLGQAPTARAQVSLARLAGLHGRIVVLERYDGTWLLVRILGVGATHVTVELEDGLRGSVPLRTIAKVRPRWTDESPPSYSAVTGTTKKASRTLPPHKYRVEWIGVRVGFGVYVDPYWGGLRPDLAGFAELTLFTLHWRHFYWEILRAGGGMPYIGHWGTAFGYPFHLDDAERHELRVGVHITLAYGYLPTLSGLQLYYAYRPKKGLAIHVGIMQTSFPFSVTAIFGVSM